MRAAARDGRHLQGWEPKTSNKHACNKLYKRRRRIWWPSIPTRGALRPTPTSILFPRVGKQFNVENFIIFYFKKNSNRANEGAAKRDRVQGCDDPIREWDP
mmetsp:Transcript_36720/g.88506  ORF Transcript_36720/g.88506 Transcript_36720/m.88506 type:complete len:101 (-) Transcript_36720:289-591(-)